MMHKSALIPSIVLVGLTPDLRNNIVLHLGKSCNIVEIQHRFSIQAFSVIPNLNLILFDIDQMNIKIEDLIEPVKAHDVYCKIPVIALAMKRHYDDFSMNLKKKFDDIILLPTNMEEMLTRIDVWIQTYQSSKKA